MPNDSPCTIGYDTVSRILSVTARLESAALDPAVSDLQGEFDGSMFLKVLAGATAGKYPCAELVYNQATGAWDNLPNEAKAFELNGATLSVGQILRGRQAGHDLNRTGGVCVLYAVQASGGGGAAGSTLIIVKLTNTVAMTGLQQTYNPTTKGWTDGVITLNLVEINGNTMPVNKRMPALLISGTTYAVGLDPAAVTNVVCSSGTLTVTRRS